jgi:hypothetical protein
MYVLWIVVCPFVLFFLAIVLSSSIYGFLLPLCSYPADVDVGGDMPVMSMVDKTYMYIRSLKRETQQVFPDCYATQEKPMPVSKLIVYCVWHVFNA